MVGWGGGWVGWFGWVWVGVDRIKFSQSGLARIPNERIMTGTISMMLVRVFCFSYLVLPVSVFSEGVMWVWGFVGLEVGSGIPLKALRAKSAWLVLACAATCEVVWCNFWSKFQLLGPFGSTVSRDLEIRVGSFFAKCNNSP